MVWAGGTTTITKEINNRAVKIVQTIFDADAEEGDSIDILKYLEKLPTDGWIKAERTVGATDTVDVDLVASVDDNIFETGSPLATAVASTNKVPVSGTTWTALFRYFKPIVGTVGAGNTLTITYVVGHRQIIMTLAALTVTLTGGGTYSSVQITDANLVASNICSGLRNATYSFGQDGVVDSGVAMLSARILDRGKNSYNAKIGQTPVPIDSLRKLVTDEIRELMLDTDTTSSKYRYSTSITSKEYVSPPSKF